VPALLLEVLLEKTGVIELGFSLASLMACTLPLLLATGSDPMAALRLPLTRRMRGFASWLALAGPALLPWLGVLAILPLMGEAQRAGETAVRILILALALWFGRMLPAPWGRSLLLVLLAWVVGARFTAVGEDTDRIAAAALLLASPAAWLPWHRIRLRSATRAGSARARTPSRPVAGLGGPRRTLVQMWWSGFARQALYMGPAIALFLAFSLAPHWMGDLLHGPNWIPLGIAIFLVLLVSQSVVSDGWPLGLPVGSLTALLCVPIRTHVLARLVLAHVVLWRGALGAGVLYVCWSFHPLTKYSPRDFIAMLAVLELSILLSTGAQNLRSRFRGPIGPRTKGVEAAMGRSIAAGLAVAFAFFVPQSDASSTWRLLPRIAAVSLAAAVNLYELWLVRWLVFPTTREQRLRIRQESWFGDTN
jgi:hypothetical protein